MQRAGCCARVVLYLPFLAVTTLFLVAPRARRSLLTLLSSPSRAGALLPLPQPLHFGLTLNTSAWSSRDTSTKLLGAKSCAG